MTRCRFICLDEVARFDPVMHRFIADVMRDRLDVRGWPTRDAAAAEEDG